MFSLPDCIQHASSFTYSITDVFVCLSFQLILSILLENKISKASVSCLILSESKSLPHIVPHINDDNNDVSITCHKINSVKEVRWANFVKHLCKCLPKSFKITTHLLETQEKYFTFFLHTVSIFTRNTISNQTM